MKSECVILNTYISNTAADAIVPLAAKTSCKLGMGRQSSCIDHVNVNPISISYTHEWFV